MHKDIKLKEVFLPEHYFDVPTILFDVYVKSMDRVVGRVEYRFESDYEVKFYGNVGYVIYPPYRGNNYAYLGTKLMLEKIAIRHPEINQVVITCNPDNIASKKTIEKLDATYLGRIKVDRHHELYRLGEKEKEVYALYL